MHAFSRFVYSLLVLMLATGCWITSSFAEDAASEFARFKKGAESGIVPAMLITADNYDRGQGVAADLGLAYEWFLKAAEKGDSLAQYMVGGRLRAGAGCTKDLTSAAKWYLKSAELGRADSQYEVARCYLSGEGMAEDEETAMKWFRAAADQGHAKAQMILAVCYVNPEGKFSDKQAAAKWMLKAAEQGLAQAQLQMGLYYFNGSGVTKDFVDAYKWALLASAQSAEGADTIIRVLESEMTPQQKADGQALAKRFKASIKPDRKGSANTAQTPGDMKGAGSGFFISADGFVVTSHHVINGARKVVLVIEGQEVEARVISSDAANDLALLKVAGGGFHPLSIASSRAVHLGDTVFSIGFPNVALQGSSPKLAKGEIASLNGIRDDPRHFQISVPLQPGNSGGALVDAIGNVVGVISHKLNPKAALASSGSPAESVNYAVKSSFLLGFLEAVPDIGPKLPQNSMTKVDFDEVVKAAEKAAVLIVIR